MRRPCLDENEKLHSTCQASREVGYSGVSQAVESGALLSTIGSQSLTSLTGPRHEASEFW